MTTATLFTRDDTLLGVCEGLGEEFGFHPNILRVALGAALLADPLVVVALYLAAGAVLALARWWWPAREPEAVAPALPATAEEPAPLPLAA